MLLKRRTPLQRHTPLKRRTPLRRSRELEPRRAKPIHYRRRKPTPEEADHLARVAALGCLICGAKAEIHHVRDGQGMGQRASHMRVLPLCSLHHRTGGMGVAFHGGPRTWQAIHGTEATLLDLVSDKLQETSCPKSA